MNLVELDPGTGRIRILDSWNINHGRDIVKAIEALLPGLTGDTLTLDFSAVHQLDSSGISDLIQLNMKLRAKNRKIVIEQASEVVRKVAKLVKLDRLVTLRD